MMVTIVGLQQPVRLALARWASRSLRLALALLITVAALGGSGTGDWGAPLARAYGGNSLYTPDRSTYPNASASSPRVIRLQHQPNGVGNGTLLATFDNGNGFDHTDGAGEPPSFAIYKSTNEGITWTGPIAVVGDAVHNWPFHQQPMMFEVPQQLGGGGGLAPGTILLVGNYEAPDTSQPGKVANQDLEVYASADQGQHWGYLSSCVTGGKSGAGTWEPYLQVDGHGNLACYFSDERANGAGYNQKIGEVVSSDGGKTWGAETTAVGVNDGISRPGMPAVLRMVNGQYIMVFETPGVPGSNNSEIREKISSDGNTWRSDLGTKIQTADGHYLGATPDLAQTPPVAGAPNGELILDAKTYADAGNTQAPETGDVLLVNTNNGSGAWSETPAPFSLAPQPTIAPDCNNYKPGLVGLGSGTSVALLAPHLIATGGSTGVCEIRADLGNAGVLPFHDAWANGADAQWSDYGGAWSVANGSYLDTAGGVGDKATAGSMGWTDYSLQGDVEVTSGGGNAGLILRVTHPGVGVDAYNGYVVGVDRATNSLLFGRDAYGYTPLHSVALPGGVALNTWYHLVVQATGCTFNVSAQPVRAVAATTFSYTDANCAQTAGQIGVRTVNAVARWRNISVTPGGTTTYPPVYAPWASGSTAGWTTYGGSWAANGAGETYADSAGGPGDKSLTGASSWGNSTLTVDVQVASGNSNAGLVARVSNPGVGVDAYTGYYAGIDAAAGNVLFGRSVNGWTQLATAPIPLGVTPNTWYHLSLQHVGCTFTVAAQAATLADEALLSYTDSGCMMTNGQAGVRAVNATTTWRYFSMIPR